VRRPSARVGRHVSVPRHRGEARARFAGRPGMARRADARGGYVESSTMPWSLARRLASSSR
jgi:hypothetical protein